MSINIAQIIQMFKSGGNPQQILMSMLQERMGGTPFGDNLISLAQQGDTSSIEKIAKNLCESKGINYEETFKKFRQQLGL